ncbi:putative abc multidrug protein [Botrytis fragariae]|uniref:Putative abc multidrug protein n=1 Tax=Botrytis fragariae TaxID=1964551 RepID=A0A8H6AYF6_9HELO|nr:putative abc multidrug protein [Botrytis fragariae]KAF5876101.1 putative abc multidrug protein [Botrytis fragariae]
MVAAIFLALLSHFEHTRSLSPSFTIGSYLCITFLPRAVITRTYWLLANADTGYIHVAEASSVALLFQIIIIVLESWSKEQWLFENTKVAAEELASFVDRSLFAWLDKLLLHGYRQKLTLLDLQPIDQTLGTFRLANDFHDIQKHPKLRRFGLLGITLRCSGSSIFFPVLPRLCLTGFSFAQPFLATSLIAYFENEGSTTLNAGYGLIGASFLTYTGIAISTGWYWHMSYKYATKLRGGLIAKISDKLLRLKQETGLESKVFTLVIADVDKIISASAYIHEIWAVVLETGLATWLLWRQIGPSSLTVLAVALICAMGSTFLGKHVGKAQQTWLAGTEKRIAATKKMLSSLKAIKMMGSGQRVRMAIEKFRDLEFVASKSFRTLLIGSLISSYSTLTLAPVVAFGTYIGSTRATNGDFNASRLFGSLILINLLASPLIRILQILPHFGAAFGCFSRVEDFFEKSEVIDSRVIVVDGIKPGDDYKTEFVGKEEVLSQEKEEYPVKSKDLSILSMRHASLGWSTETILHDINFEIVAGQHVAVTGPVGCGKSLLLQAILGEVELKAGTMHVGGVGIGYCSQNPWLKNVSAYENAFRSAPSDKSWENLVADSCNLGGLLNVESAHQTVGSGGAKISGGERQRLALARAIATRPAILLLDDVFSAIDKTTKTSMQEKLFGRKGILREQRTTVINVTQDQQFIEAADMVLRIDDAGSLQQLQPIACTIQSTVEDKIEGKPINATQSSPGSQSRSKSDHSDPTKITDKRVYQAYLLSIGRSNITIFFIGAIIFAFTFRFPNIWAEWWSNANTGISTRSVEYWMGIYAFLNLLPLIAISLWVAHLMLKIIPTSGIGLHGKLLRSVLNAPFIFISTIDSGSLINRFNQDLMLVDTQLPFQLLNTVSGLFAAILQAILITISAVYIVAILPVLAAVLFLIQNFYLRTSKQLRQLDLESKAGLHTMIAEVYEGLVTIRAHGWQNIMQGEFYEKLERSQEPIYLLYMVQTWLQLTLNLVVAGLAVVVVGVAIGLRHKTSAGGIGVAFFNLTIQSWTALETSLGAIARIEAFEQETPVEPEVTSPTDVPMSWPTSGQLSFENVWTSYNLDVEKPSWSLRGMTLKIDSGERIAICGRSGSGKSTLLLSLLALIETTKGSIYLDGIDISKVQRYVLRSKLHVISQDAFTDGEIIRDALDPAGKLSDETINDALRDCALLNKINASGSLSANLGDVTLSVGETQLFVLARTILGIEDSNKGGIVLLDEATSSIDVATERKIMNVVAKRLQGKTVISVLHRLEAAVEFDKILVLEKGEMAHFGPPEEKLKLSLEDIVLAYGQNGDSVAPRSSNANGISGLNDHFIFPSALKKNNYLACFSSELD